MAVALNDMMTKVELAKNVVALMDVIEHTERFIASQPNRRKATRWLIANASSVIAIWPVIAAGRMAFGLELVRRNPAGNGLVAAFRVADEAECEAMVEQYGDRRAA